GISVADALCEFTNPRKNSVVALVEEHLHVEAQGNEIAIGVRAACRGVRCALELLEAVECAPQAEISCGSDDHQQPENDDIAGTDPGADLEAGIQIRKPGHPFASWSRAARPVLWNHLGA